MGKKDPSLTLQTDPDVRDPAVFQRLRSMIQHEACHPRWGVVLYHMFHQGQITNAEREAGDRYHSICLAFRRMQELDPDEFPSYMQEDIERKIQTTRDRYRMCESLLGARKAAVDRVVLDNELCVGEQDRINVKYGLEAISIHFGRGK